MTYNFSEIGDTWPEHAVRKRGGDGNILVLYEMTVLIVLRYVWSVLCEGDGTQLTVSACYSWGMMLNVDINVSLVNM